MSEPCVVCAGTGWHWWWQLEHADISPASDVHDCYSDDTRYSCQRCDGKGWVPGEGGDPDPDWWQQ